MLRPGDNITNNIKIIPNNIISSIINIILNNITSSINIILNTITNSIIINIINIITNNIKIILNNITSSINIILNNITKNIKIILNNITNSIKIILDSITSSNIILNKVNSTYMLLGSWDLDPALWVQEVVDGPRSGHTSPENIVIVFKFFHHRYVHVFLALDQFIGHLKIIFYRPQPFMYFDTLLVLAKIKFQQQKKVMTTFRKKIFSHLMTILLY